MSEGWTGVKAGIFLLEWRRQVVILFAVLWSVDLWNCASPPLILRARCWNNHRDQTPSMEKHRKLSQIIARIISQIPTIFRTRKGYSKNVAVMKTTSGYGQRSSVLLVILACEKRPWLITQNTSNWMNGNVLALTGGGLLLGRTEAFPNVPFGEEEICRNVWNLNLEWGLCHFGWRSCPIVWLQRDIRLKSKTRQFLPAVDFVWAPQGRRRADDGALLIAKVIARKGETVEASRVEGGVEA